MFTRAKILRNVGFLLDPSPLKRTLFKSSLKSEADFVQKLYALQHRQFNTSAGSSIKENIKDQKNSEAKNTVTEQSVLKSIPGTLKKQEPLKRVNSEKQTRQPREKFRQNKYRNLYSFVLLRVLSSCKLYLSFSPEELKNITEKSRFNYLLKEFGEMSEEEKKAFGDYMEEYIASIWQPGEKKKTRLNAFDDEFAKDQKQEPPVVDKKRSSKNYTGSRVKKFLQNPTYGGRMSRLILQFLDQNNPDFQSYLKAEEEERKPGVFAPNRSKLGEKSKNALQNELEQFRMLYTRILKKL